MEVAKQLQGRYSCLQEIDQITKETQEAFARNDAESARMLLGMRGECMEKADRYREKEEKLFSTLEHTEAKLLNGLIHNEVTAEEFPEQCRKAAAIIAVVSENTRKLLDRIIQNDQVMNRRITGSKSYYQKKD